MEINHYKSIFLAHLKDRVKIREPRNLYEPILYILNLGGKRIRPALTLMSCGLFGENENKALDAALAIEMFHNFSLVHDDIMDAAPLRRGLKTVHEKWSINAGILSGDAMLVWANQFLETYEGNLYKKLTSLFNTTALQICEGQQYDFDFESRQIVTIDEYKKMITLKTAVLLATSLKFGAMIAGASEKDSENIYEYGINLGIAFQLQDDFLDVFGDENFGKQSAGDIIENKKTFLFLKTYELANNEDKLELLNLYSTKKYSKIKIKSVIKLFKKYTILSKTDEEIRHYTTKAVHYISKLSLPIDKKKILEKFANQLMERRI